MDALAKNAADHSTKTDYGYQPGKFTATRTKNKKAATLFPARGQSALIRVYRKNIYGKGENQVYKITFDIFDEVKKSYSDKFVAYKDENCPDLKRNNCYKVLFNNSETYPMFQEAEWVEYIKPEN